MDRCLRFLAPAALLGGLLAPADLSAQSNVSSSACANPTTTCFAVSGSVVFGAGEAPPSEVSIRARLIVGEGAETLELRASGPDYRFEVRAPRFASGDLRLIGLPSPWMDDQAADIASVTAPQQVTVRSAIGVPVTATFRYPQGTTAPPSFLASVRRSPGDRTFTPVQITNGQFTFLARRDVAYTITASPQGFGNVGLTFPAQAVAHAVVVDVDRLSRPTSQPVTIVEGPGPSPGASRRLLVPITLEERSPSGGETLPYALSIVPGTAANGDLTTCCGATAGSRERFALAPVFVRNDAVAGADRTAALRLTPDPIGGPAAPDVPLTMIDDDSSARPSLLSIVGASLRSDGEAAMVLARPEGAAGEDWDITLQLDAPAPAGGSAVTVDTIGGFGVIERRVTFAEGATTATLTIADVGDDQIEPEARFFLALTNPQGLVPRDPVIELRILNDDVDNSPAARPDQIPVSPLRQSNVLDVLANDVAPVARFEFGRLEIDAAQFGVVFVDRRGTTTPLDDRIVYSPNSGQAGKTERLTYRLCAPLDEVCISARLDILIRPVTPTSTAFAPDSEAGYRDIAFSGVTVLSEARADVLSRPIAAAEITERTLAPGNPRFALDWQPASTGLPTVPSGQTVRRTFVAHLRGPAGSDVDLHVGYDANNDFVIDAGERLCSSAGTGAVETCLVTFEQTSAGATTLHVAVSNPGPQPVPVRFVVGSVANLGALPGVAATLPTRIAAGADFSARLSWRSDATALPHGAIGILRINNAGDIGLGDLPVVIDLPRADTALAAAPALAPAALRSGVARTLQVPVGGSRDRAFIDVPAGTAQLAIALSRTGILNPLDVSLRRVDLPSDGAIPAPAVAPASDANSITRSMTGATLDLVVTSPAAGRWYLVLQDNRVATGGQDALLATATLSTGSDAPVVRPGGFYNPARSGHGLFLYPSGSQWVGLWYTYQQDGEPVWYYLQGAAPGTNGLWTAPIYRSGWNGSSNQLTEVGRAIATPTGPDAFQFTYVLDGETGSEPFTTFGRGCPTQDNRVINASGHWFDATRAGTGYSVQLFPNYEFHAVFAYSPRGEPRFLLGERPNIGSPNDTMPLQQLRGFCPLCTRTGNPSRATVGTLRRIFTNGVLTGMNVDATFTNGTTGTWVVNDTVAPLGGLQGCAAN